LRNRALDDQTIISPQLQLFTSTYDAFKINKYAKPLALSGYLVNEYYVDTFE